MKKMFTAALVVVVGLLLGTGVYALSGPGYGPGQTKEVDVTAFRNFQKETLPLRDELTAKGLEVRNEYLKDTPDLNKIGSLQKEMIDLRTKIQTSAQKNGLPNLGYGRGMMGRGGQGYGPGMMGRGGYGPQAGVPANCPMW
jgi:hypothetical protein